MDYDRRTEELVDATLAESFPASDPPFFMAAMVAGPPAHPANSRRGWSPNGSQKSGKRG
jgi:hypothetical protein